jgi:UDP-N-acetylglucosamine:LPS N-acetylglucosamine transferase
VILQALSKLTGKYNLVHQCGLGKAGRDLEMLSAARDNLSRKQAQRYLIKKWFTDQQVAWLLRHADLVISRSGANIVTEIALLKVKALFVPLPISGRNEQLKNANLLKDCGTAEIIKQDEFDAEILLTTIEKMLKQSSEYQKNMDKARSKVNPKAALQVVQLVREVYEKEAKDKKAD